MCNNMYAFRKKIIYSSKIRIIYVCNRFQDKNDCMILSTVFFFGFDISPLFCFKYTQFESKTIEKCPITRSRTQKLGTKSVH